jgi:hypothetical protein
MSSFEVEEKMICEDDMYPKVRETKKTTCIFA